LCDPKAALYERFGIQPAASMAKMADAGTMLKIAKATASGYKHGAYEGNELQLPACFVVDKERKILYAHYGKSAGNTPDARTLASLLK
jgi:peroxiredoxin